MAETKKCNECKSGQTELKIKPANADKAETFVGTFNFCPNCGRRMEVK